MRASWFLLALLMAACASAPKPPAAEETHVPAPLASVQVDAVTMRDRLIFFADEAAAELIGAMSNIAAATSDRTVREQTLLFKMRIIPILYLTAQESDPRTAFIDLWVLVVRLRHYLADGEGKARFGDQQALAVESVQRIEQNLLELGRRLLPPAVIDESRDEVEEIAAAYPLTGRYSSFVHAADVAAPKQKGALDAILGVPLAPVRGLQGLSDTASSVRYAAQAFEAFTQVFELLPEHTRWQIEMVLLEADSLESVVKTRESLERLATGVDSISQTVRTLPQDVRQELEIALHDAEPAMERLERTLATAQLVGEEVNKAGAAWEAAAGSFNQVLASVKELRGNQPAPGTGAAEVPSELAQLTRAAEEARSAAAELRGLLEDLDSGKLAAVLAQVDKTSTSSIDHAALRLEDIVNRITWRALLLVAAIVAAIVICRVVAGRLNRAAGSRAGAERPAR